MIALRGSFPNLKIQPIDSGRPRPFIYKVFEACNVIRSKFLNFGCCDEQVTEANKQQ